MAASFSLVRLSHPRLLLPLLMFSLHLYSVLSNAPPPHRDCSTDFRICSPFNYTDATPGCGMNVISCRQGSTWISLFNQSFCVRNISYNERKIDIDYNQVSFIREHLCNRNPQEFEAERSKLFKRGVRFSIPQIAVFICGRACENPETPKEVTCGDDSASCFVYRLDPHFCTNWSGYENPAPSIPLPGGMRNETLSLEWESDCDSGCSNLPGCQGEDGSTKPNNCEVARGGKRPKDVPLGIILGSAAVVGILLVACLLYFITRSHRVSSSRNHTPTKVEKFLIDYEAAALTATRYTYNDISKMTNKFNSKLGQGGYGSVYRGRLSNGMPVAVKLMEKSYNDGEEFCNEVSTIGRIHHVNVVRLLGFCVEGSRRALVYEFMANGSLEKLENTVACCLLFRERLNDIALGVARGIEYLHQGCERRIIHFDIKPHNILLDHDFTPKISDFGLAKSYGRDRSIVTITEGRGTIGYVAPEVFYDNSRHASHKSDVYSYGMLLLSMVGVKEKNGPADASSSSSSEAYFPQWIYETLTRNRKLEGFRELEDEMIRKMATIALWCIQWNPNDRPCMKEVVRMLEGSTSNLRMPPNHFYPPIEPKSTISGIDSSSISK